MKRRKTRTEITVETERIMIIRRTGTSVLAHCEQCGEEVTMIQPEDAAVLSRITPGMVYERLQAGTIHGKKMKGGLLMICKKSLS